MFFFPLSHQISVTLAPWSSCPSCGVLHPAQLSGSAQLTGPTQLSGSAQLSGPLAASPSARQPDSAAAQVQLSQSLL